MRTIKVFKEIKSTKFLWLFFWSLRDTWKFLFKWLINSVSTEKIHKSFWTRFQKFSFRFKSLLSFPISKENPRVFHYSINNTWLVFYLLVPTKFSHNNYIYWIFNFTVGCLSDILVFHLKCFEIALCALRALQFGFLYYKWVFEVSWSGTSEFWPIMVFLAI